MYHIPELIMMKGPKSPSSPMIFCSSDGWQVSQEICIEKETVASRLVHLRRVLVTSIGNQPVEKYVNLKSAHDI